MGLFDIFSNSDANNAAQAQIQGYQTGLNNLTNTIQGQAIPALQQNFGAANQALGQNYGAANQALQQNYTAGLAPSQQNFGTAAAGTNQLASLLGFGPQGSAGIQQTLAGLPGFQFAMDQGSQNVLRNASATGGGVNSGGTLNALQQQGQGTAEQFYNNYVTQLQPFLGYSTANAQNIGSLYGALGQGQSGNYGQLGQGLSGNLTGLGQQEAGLYGGLGQAQYGSAVGQGNAQAQADYAQLAQSGQLWNMLGSLAGGGLKLAGGGFKPPGTA